MRVLITNDDGISAPGLIALVTRFASRHSIIVVAPEREMSATSHAISLHVPLRVKRVALSNGYDGFAVSGTPADCVKLAVTEFMSSRPDMVVSGLNPGANLGIDVLYSGTVAAAREGALFGIPSMATAVDSRNPTHLDTAALIVERLACKIYERYANKGVCFNVNIPDVLPEEIKGIRFSRQETTRVNEFYEKREDPRKMSYYWLGQCTGSIFSDPAGDGLAVREKYISITPLRSDITDYKAIKEASSLSRDLENLLKEPEGGLG